ncbi:hypothetical protein KQ693_10355 [Thermus sp. PS18]|uniref:hypothetical protein n=1 Tax=Thermus sp. PS18 TaxID=2849039 RepID=UPI0022651B83|nr:hypothetical protein [Thermus sp. PS18]UZX15017.1 hypothetical protein KQ693_10355 [Thermus sp. PS18]
MEGDDEVLAFLEGLLSRYPRRMGGLSLHAFLDEEGRWTLALFLGEALVALDWGYDPLEVEEALWRRFSSWS